MSDEQTNMSSINEITDDTKAALKRKSVENIPDRPTAAGMSAAEIKAAFYKPIYDEENSVIAELARVISEANALFANLFGKIEGKDGLDDRIGANTKALGDLKTLVGDSLPEGLTEKTVIAYIESVAKDLANVYTKTEVNTELAKKSAIKVDGELKSEWDASGVVKKAALTEALNSYVLQSAFNELQATVNLILDNPDTKDVDSIKDFVDYIADHGEVAKGLQEAIKNKLDAKFEAIDDNKIRFVVAYPDGSIKAEKIATGGSY